ncbi:MAG TPA: VOC family protein [Telluria sp.]|jgi:catechol 2,3-dioxygenase-like lactoylglutathione lyase family enzyme
MLHHISLGVRDLALAGAFYDAAFATLGYRRVFEDDDAIGYGLIDEQDILCLKLNDAALAPGPGFHLAFSAASRAQVDAFYAAALKIGGRCNGAPGLRPDYGDHYYAAFLIDTDGYRIEVVTKARPA